MSFDSPPPPAPDQTEKGIAGAVFKEISAGIGAGTSMKAPQGDLSSHPATKDFPIVLTGFQQGKEQTPEKPKSDTAKEKPKDQPKDKPMTKEEQIKDARERGALLLKDSIAGKWSPKTQETWRKLFNDVSKIPGITGSEVHNIFNKLGSDINDRLEKAGVEHRVGMAEVIDEKTGETTIFMQINGPKTRAANAVDTLLGNSTETNTKAGTAKFAPEKEEPKAKPRTNNRTA